MNTDELHRLKAKTCVLLHDFRIATAADDKLRSRALRLPTVFENQDDFEAFMKFVAGAVDAETAAKIRSILKS